MRTLLGRLKKWGNDAFPSSNPVLNRIGHGLVGSLIVTAVMAAWYLPWRFLGFPGDYFAMPWLLGMHADVGAYGFKEEGTDDHPDAWDFWAAVIGGAVPYLIVIAVRVLS